jgi:hypothetical protein
MQTFLPYAEFWRSVGILDQKRLGKQRVECLQLLGAIESPDKGWGSHPCTKMWRPYGGALLLYGLLCCRDWTLRGHRDTCRDKMLKRFDDKYGNPDRVEWAFHRIADDDNCQSEAMLSAGIIIPWWLGNPSLHNSHKAMLWRKDPDFYRMWEYLREKPEDYWWPKRQDRGDPCGFRPHRMHDIEI